MNKVITIHLCGAAYQLEEGGYEALRNYLDTAGARLGGNPDREEILSDIERAIGEKFRVLLGNYKTVVTNQEVAAVIAELGPIETDAEAAAGAGASGAAAGGQAGGEPAGQKESGPWRPGTPKRLYRIHEGAMLAGVCNGLAAYFNIDPTLVRLAFVFLTMVWGTGVLVYLVMAIVVPEARSPEERAAASGMPSTAQEFIRRAKAGYYEAMKGFPDRKARRAWRRRFRQDLRGWRLSFEREMRANAEQWRQNWHHHWAEQAPAGPGPYFALPLVSLLHGAAAIALLCAMISLLATGGLFGVALPPRLPVWGAAVLLLVGYSVFTWPLKAARRACYWRPGWPGPGGVSPVVAVLDVLVWLVVVGVLVWLAAHYFPELRDAVAGVPSVVHHAADDVRTWWKGN